MKRQVCTGAVLGSSDKGPRDLRVDQEMILVLSQYPGRPHLVACTVAPQSLESLPGTSPQGGRGEGGDHKTQLRGPCGCLGGAPASFSAPCLVLVPRPQPRRPAGLLCTPHPGVLSSQHLRVCIPWPPEIVRDLQRGTTGSHEPTACCAACRAQSGDKNPGTCTSKSRMQRKAFLHPSSSFCGARCALGSPATLCPPLRAVPGSPPCLSPGTTGH